MYIKRYKQIKVSEIKNSRFTNWFWYIHRTKEYIKIDLLRRAYEHEPYVKSILFYCYNPEFTINLSPIAIKLKDKCKQSEYKGLGVGRSYKKFLSILDSFMKGETTKKQTYNDLYKLYTLCNRYTRWVFNRVLDRELLIGSDIRLLRKHFPELFSEFYTENWKTIQKLDSLTFPVLVTEITGRRTLIVSKDKFFSLKTAQGYDVILDESFQIKLPKDIVLEGIIEKKEKTKRATKCKHKYIVVDGKFKKINRKKEIIREYTFYCFDYIPLSEFEGKEKELTLQERFKIMKMLNIDRVKILPSKIANNQENLLSFIKEAKQDKILIREFSKKYGDGCYFVYKKNFMDI